MGNYVNSHLIMGETVVYSAKLHWIIYLAAKAILTIWIAPFIQQATSSEFAITTKRVIIKEGLIARRTLEMNLSKIETGNVDQSIMGRIIQSMHFLQALYKCLPHRRHLPGRFI